MIKSIQSELLKTKRTAASWMSVLGGVLIPFIYFIVFLVNKKSLNSSGNELNAWVVYSNQIWRNMNTFLLPAGIILAISLLTQIEYKNNTWKQLHTSPQSFHHIYFSKYTILFFMVIKFFLILNIAIVVSGLLPCVIFDNKMPTYSFPYKYFLKQNIKYFISILPIISFQFLLSLKFRNFIVPIGIGILGLILTLLGLSWKYIFLSPYSYASMTVVDMHKNYSIYSYSVIYFIVLFGLGFYLYNSKKDKY